MRRGSDTGSARPPTSHRTVASHQPIAVSDDPQGGRPTRDLPIMGVASHRTFDHASERGDRGGQADFILLQHGTGKALPQESDRIADLNWEIEGDQILLQHGGKEIAVDAAPQSVTNMDIHDWSPRTGFLVNTTV